jgi:hypothetical protein
MPPEIHADQPAPAASLSRRSLLRGAAGAGAVSVAAAAGAGTIFAVAGPASAAPTVHADTVHADTVHADTVHHGTGAQPAGDEPIVAYLRDAATGEFEVFHGTRQVRVRDRKLAVQLLNQVR